MVKKEFRILFLLAAILICFTTSGFCEYANLVGKWAKIQGPFCWDNIALSLRKETCDDYAFLLKISDEETYEEALNSFDVVRVQNPISAVVLDVLIFENKAKVMVLEGLHRGRSGWVPLSWININKGQPTFTKK